jgi:putative ABC transport system permease protein
MKSGSFAGVAKAGVLISDNAARTMGVHVGQSIPMEFAKTGVTWFHVVGIFDNASAVGNEFLISLPDFEANFAETQDTRVFVKGDPGIPLASLRRTLETVTGRFPNVTLMDEAELNQSQQKQIDQLLALVNALLGLAIVIALVGIANTLGLSIMERTRELGLLRAVGMSRHQTRSMVRWEAVIITLLGATLGLVIGLFFGWAVVRALHDQGIKVLALPGIQLLVYLIGAGVAGVIAATLPARRAARMEILGAIASE